MAIFINDSKLMVLRYMQNFIFHFMPSREPIASLLDYYQEESMV